MNSMVLSEMIESVQLIVKSAPQREELFLYLFSDLEDELTFDEFEECLGESDEYDNAFHTFFEEDEDEDEECDDTDEDELDDEFDAKAV